LNRNTQKYEHLFQFIRETSLTKKSLPLSLQVVLDQRRQVVDWTDHEGDFPARESFVQPWHVHERYIRSGEKQKMIALQLDVVTYLQLQIQCCILTGATRR
jgi:hypothetical protein